MTVSTTTNVTTYTGNGSTTAFATGFPFYSNGDVQVTRITIADGTRTLLIQDVDYTIVGAGLDAGGTVTTIGSGSPVSALYQVEIKRQTAQTQTLDLVPNDSLSAEAAEDAFDKLTMICQEVSAQITAVAAGGSGAFTISNRPGSGSGWYSQQVGNDFQFKKLLVSDDFTLSDSADEIVLRMSHILNRNNRDIVSSPLIIDDANSFALSWRNTGGPSGSQAITTLLVSNDLTVDNAQLKFIGAGNDGIADKNIILELTQHNDGETNTVARAQLFGHLSEYNQGNVSGSVTIDLNRGGRQKCTLTGNISTLTVTAPYNSGLAHGHFDFIQDGTGSRTIAWPSSFKWASNKTATDKLLSTAASSRDRLVWDYNGTDYLVDLIKGRV